MITPFTETQRMIRDSIRTALEQEIGPIVNDLESGKILPFEPLRNVMTNIGVLGEEGLGTLGDISQDEAGLDLYIPRILIIELSRICAGLAASWTVNTGLVSSIIMKQGTEEQKIKYAHPLRNLEIVGSWGLTEYSAGSAAFRDMKTTAIRAGDSYILNGSKTFITNSPNADVFIIWAKLEEGGKQTPRAFIVERNDEGIDASRALVKMGMKSSPTGEVFLDDCTIPLDRLLEPSRTMSRSSNNKKTNTKKNWLSNERFGLQLISYGIMERAFEIALAYAREREVGGRTIGNYQLIQRRLARMYMNLNNAHNLIWSDLLSSKTIKANAADNSTGKLYVSEMGTWMANEAIHILGGFGYLQDGIVERLARDAKIVEIGSGTTEIQEITAGSWLLENYVI